MGTTTVVFSGLKLTRASYVIRNCDAVIPATQKISALLHQRPRQTVVREMTPPGTRPARNRAGTLFNGRRWGPTQRKLKTFF